MTRESSDLQSEIKLLKINKKINTRTQDDLSSGYSSVLSSDRSLMNKNGDEIFSDDDNDEDNNNNSSNNSNNNNIDISSYEKPNQCKFYL